YSPDRPDVANRAINAYANSGRNIELVPWQYLTDVDAWYMQLTGRGLIFFWRRMTRFAREREFQTGDDTVAGYALVADHPQQEFVVQATGTAVGIAANGLCGQLTSAGGNTGTGLSTMELNGDAIANTATYAVQLLHAVPGQDAALTNCDWIVKINAHFMNAGITGV
ncbi:unnamed protein product, partial [marine sediment metagenome]